MNLLLLPARLIPPRRSRSSEQPPRRDPSSGHRKGSGYAMHCECEQGCRWIILLSNTFTRKLPIARLSSHLSACCSLCADPSARSPQSAFLSHGRLVRALGCSAAAAAHGRADPRTWSLRTIASACCFLGHPCQTRTPAGSTCRASRAARSQTPRNRASFARPASACSSAEPAARIETHGMA